MIMTIAIARDGFININETPNYSVEDNFLQCLQKTFNFENKDLQDFDGNTCVLINSYDPTNSIFIYENQQGVFLYQITSATPYLHLNNMLWNCNCYKMEDLEKINNICQTGKGAQFNMIKNIMPSAEREHNPTFKKVEIKNNFRPKEIFSERVGFYLCALKIKCYVNPTELTLVNKSNDGAFNFFFPMLTYDTTTMSGETETDITNEIELLTATQGVLKLSDIISKYSEVIKSIEIIPFFPTTISEMGGGITRFERSSNTLKFDLLGNAVWTDLGVFIPQGHYSEDYDFTIDLPNYFLPSQAIKGGGARGFLQTPLGNIQLDFELNKRDVYYNICSYILKDDGWKLDGAFKCEVPPHYLNFYTDNAGQVFIQNLTTNAQELRQLERETLAKQYERQEQYVLGNVQKAETFNVANIFNPLAWFSTGQEALSSATQNEFDKAKIQRDYARSLTEYKDKIETQSLLASLQGKQVSGNVGIIEFLESFNCQYFKLFIELNFSLQYVDSTHNLILCQKDYDYSTTCLPNPTRQNTGAINQTNKILALFGSAQTANYNNSVAGVFNQIFGFNTNQQINFIDGVGLNYSVVFNIENTIVTGQEFTSLQDFKFTNVLNFPIRRSVRVRENEV